MSFAGTRKHLNLLIQDYGVSTNRSSIESKTEKAEQMAQILEEEKAKKSFEPPYLVGGTHSRDIARMVNARRTPSGNFFQVTNPSLAPTVMECQQQRHKSFADVYMKKSEDSIEGEGDSGADINTVTFESEIIQPDDMGETAAFDDTSKGESGHTSGKVQFDGATLAESTSFKPSRTRSWTMPSLMNDRENGARVAKLVASKRTPTGGFYAVQA